MSKIIVLGAGICGSAAALLLRRDGHEVTVLEQDPQSAPVSVLDAWENWARDGVTQFHQPHYLQSRGRMILEEELPDIIVTLESAGGLRFDAMSLMPPSIKDRTPRDGDERFKTTTARRPVLEQVIRLATETERGIDLRPGVSVRELLVTRYNGTPHVSGVRTDAGEELYADLVVDAMGRHSQLPRWLESAGAASVHEEVEDPGFVYYTRHFRSRTGKLPEVRGPLLTPIGTFSVLTLPADNHTWSVTLFSTTGEQLFKRLRDPGLWTALVAACPRHVQWLDGEPITGLSCWRFWPAPGGGSSAACACAIAASLVEMAAAFSPEYEETARRAAGLRARALELAEIELHAYEPVLEALRLPRDDPERAMRSRGALLAEAAAQAAGRLVAINLTEGSSVHESAELARRAHAAREAALS
jgi:2-polyprenyl-6-methoxyphenol hydroxylase-like FAD-dependent oxidoreductase